jgi:hypothetical protein
MISQKVRRNYASAPSLEIKASIRKSRGSGAQGCLGARLGPTVNFSLVGGTKAKCADRGFCGPPASLVHLIREVFRPGTRQHLHQPFETLPAVRQQVSRIVAWLAFDSGKARGASNIDGLQTPSEAADEF